VIMRFLCLPLLLVVACGPSREPQPTTPMSDAHGAHAGAFRPPNDNAADPDQNTEAANQQ
jgi:hypothetical protein